MIESGSRKLSGILLKVVFNLPAFSILSKLEFLILRFAPGALEVKWYVKITANTCKSKKNGVASRKPPLSERR